MKSVETFIMNKKSKKTEQQDQKDLNKDSNLFDPIDEVIDYGELPETEPDTEDNKDA